MVSHHEYTLRPGRASWTSHIPWSLALSEYMEPLNGGQSGGIHWRFLENSGWSSTWYWLMYGYNWLYLYVSIICIYVYLYVSICIYMYLYVSICIYMYLYVYIYMADGFHGGNHLNNGLFGCQTRRGEEVTETVPANIWKGDMRAHRMQIGKNMLDWNLVLPWIASHLVI